METETATGSHPPEHHLPDTIAVLSRTPAALDALLRDLPDMWTRRGEAELILRRCAVFSYGQRDNKRMRFVIRAVAAALLFGALPVWAADPLIATWRLDKQEVNGQSTQSEPMLLRITPSAGDKLSFAFSVPVNNIYFVSMSYTVKLDGAESAVKNADGEKIGVVRITSAGPSHYKLFLKAPNRPDSIGTLTVSSNGKILTSEAESTSEGRTMHSKQTFSRQ